MSRLVLGFMWLLRFLPAPLIARLGSGIGALMFWLIAERRRVTRINLAKCFPAMKDDERERLARAHFRVFMRAFLERGVLWWAPAERVRDMVMLEEVEHLRVLAGKPVVVFAPHFEGLDAGGMRLSQRSEERRVGKESRSRGRPDA